MNTLKTIKDKLNRIFSCPPGEGDHGLLSPSSPSGRGRKRGVSMGPRKNEKGFILVLTLVTMVALALIGISLMMNITTDMQLSRNEKESMQAFQLAEAGIRDASARLHLTSSLSNYVGEKTTDTGYRTTSWNSTGVKDFSSGSTIIGALPANQSYAVTIRYLDENNTEGFCDSNGVSPNTSSNTILPTVAGYACNKNPAEIVMFGQDFNLDPSVTSIVYGQLPVYKVTSTATVNSTTRQVVAYLGASNLQVDPGVALTSNSCITQSGSAHPAITNSDGTTGTLQEGPGCAAPAVCGTVTCTNLTAGTLTNMNTFLGDSIANIKTYADQTITCATNPCTVAGVNWNGKLDQSITSWGSSGSSTLLVVDNAGGVDATMSGNITGYGILIITGNMAQSSGNITWNGLIYVMGTLTLGGNITVEGSVMSGGTSQLNGSAMTVDHNPAMLTDMGHRSSSSATIVWKRM